MLSAPGVLRVPQVPTNGSPYLALLRKPQPPPFAEDPSERPPRLVGEGLLALLRTANGHPVFPCPHTITLPFQCHLYYAPISNCADPKEVKLYELSCDNAEIEFLTRNGAPTVSVNNVNTYLKLTGSDHESRNVSKANKAWLLVDDVPYAQRLAKALKHAVELCGGKKSKF